MYMAHTVCYNIRLLFMTLTLIVASLNFGGSSSPTKINALNNFLKAHDIDILFMQEIRHSDFTGIYNYNAYVNIGTHPLGTAILTKPAIELQSIQKLPSGRGICGTYQNHTFCNIYAPSGSNKHRKGIIFLEKRFHTYCGHCLNI